MLYGLVGSLPMLTDILALSGEPPAVGVKVTAIVQVEFAATVEPHVPPLGTKSLAFDPLMLSLTDSDDPALLVIVTSLVFVGVLEVSVP
jgi:hypothetical protein